MKCLIVLTLEIEDPEAIITALEWINPETVPSFAGKLRIVIDPSATIVEDWLDKDTGDDSHIAEKEDEWVIADE